MFYRIGFTCMLLFGFAVTVAAQQKGAVVKSTPALTAEKTDDILEESQLAIAIQHYATDVLKESNGNQSGIALLQQKKYKEAMGVYLELANESKDPAILLTRALLYLYSIRDYAAALADLQTVVALEPSRKNAQWAYFIGLCHLGNKAYNPAMTAFAGDLDTPDETLRESLLTGLSRVLKHKYAADISTENLFKSWQKHQPISSNQLHYAAAEERPALMNEYKNMFAAATQLNPYNYWAYLRMMQVYDEMGEPEMALAMYKKADSINNDPAVYIYYNSMVESIRQDIENKKYAAAHPRQDNYEATSGMSNDQLIAACKRELDHEVSKLRMGELAAATSDIMEANKCIRENNSYCVNLQVNSAISNLTVARNFAGFFRGIVSKYQNKAINPTPAQTQLFDLLRSGLNEFEQSIKTRLAELKSDRKDAIRNMNIKDLYKIRGLY